MKNEKLKEAFYIITKKLKEDKDYYYAWQSNIAIPFQDILDKENCWFLRAPELSNQAAKNFLDLLIKQGEKYE